MQASEKPRNPRPDTDDKLWDSRKRGGRYFTNLALSDTRDRKASRVVTHNDAKDNFDRLKTKRTDNRLVPLGLTPTLGDYVQVHTQRLAVSGKRAATVEKETANLNARTTGDSARKTWLAN